MDLLPEISNIILDIDGTLVDSTDVILNAFKRGFEEINQQYPGDKELQLKFGKKLINILKELNVSENKFDKFNEIFLKTELESSEYQLINGMEKVLDLIENKYPPIIFVTSKQDKTAKHLLKTVELFDRADTIITADTVTRTKPDPEPLLKACESLGTKPSENIYYIGDTKFDYKAAKNAGLSFIGVTWGVHGSYIEKLNEELVVTSPNELYDLIS